jgi:hypothetical protein
MGNVDCCQIVQKSHPGMQSCRAADELWVAGLIFHNAFRGSLNATHLAGETNMLQAKPAL